MNPAFIHSLSDVQTAAIGAGTRLWQFLVIMPGARIGNDWNICSHSLTSGLTELTGLGLL